MSEADEKRVRELNRSGRVPRVSILMNCYNGEEDLREALDSVLAQTYDDWELVFWDNQSTDATAEIFRSYDDPRFRYLRSAVHTDLGGARAGAWPELRGELVAVLDADDVWLPQKLERQVPVFDTDPDIGIVISDTLFFDGTREWKLYGERMPPQGWVFSELLSSYFVSLETLMFRRSAALALPRAFDPEFSHIADFDLVVRLSRVAKLALVPEVLAKWRIRADGESWTRRHLFDEEKWRFLAKLDAEMPELRLDYAEARDRFIRGIVRSETLQAVLAGDRRKAWRLIRDHPSLDPKTLMLGALCWIPKSNALVRGIRKALGMPPL